MRETGRWGSLKLWDVPRPFPLAMSFGRKLIKIFQALRLPMQILIHTPSDVGYQAGFKKAFEFYSNSKAPAF
jgi:hypothetical protein